MFTIEYRDLVRDRILQLAASDPRLVAGAVVGSLALGNGDRWSDLDLTFAVADSFSIFEVLEDWTCTLAKQVDAAHLFDLPSGASIYRVFLLPGCLQLDLSFTPASQFGATGPRFRLLFGSSVDKPYTQLPSAQDLFGWAVHHALRARFCIERGRYLQAEYWIHNLRDYSLNLACLQSDLPAVYGRGFDDLPTGVRDVFKDTLVASLTRQELMRALRCAIDGLLHVAANVQDLPAKIEPQLRLLTVAWDD
jgi:hypothetical protein